MLYWDNLIYKLKHTWLFRCLEFHLEGLTAMRSSLHITTQRWIRRDNTGVATIHGGAFMSLSGLISLGLATKQRCRFLPNTQRLLEWRTVPATFAWMHSNSEYVKPGKISMRNRRDLIQVPEISMTTSSVTQSRGNLTSGLNAPLLVLSFAGMRHAPFSWALNPLSFARNYFTEAHRLS